MSQGEQVLVRGTVVGEPGVAVAGWVSLGKKQPQRWLSHTLRIKTDEGHEIDIEGLGADSILHVVTRSVEWREIESDELARLCSREAPAPDVDVDFTTAVLRGGDAVVAWGTAIDYGYAGASGPSGDPAFRGTQERTVTKLSARVIATGDDRDELVAEARDRMREQAAKEARRDRDTARGRDATNASAAKRKSKAKAKPKYPGYTNRIAFNAPLWLALAGIAVAAVVAHVDPSARAHATRAGAMFALSPIALDAVLIPRFRNGRQARASLELPFILYLIAGVLALLMSYALTVKDVAPSKIYGVTIGAYLTSSIAAIAAAWLFAATRTRQRYVAIMRGAPPHPHPIVDATWGYVEGTFSSEVLAAGNHNVSSGTGKNAVVRSSPVLRFGVEAPLRTAHTAHHVALTDAAILTVAHAVKSTGALSEERVDVIDGVTPVRVVGRTDNGVFIKGGEASLLVFAAGAGTEVATELRRLHRRHQLATVLAAVGLAALVASYVI